MLINPSNDDLKILIVSTPKTGNTWLRYLLHHVYNLPMRELGIAIDLTQLDQGGKRWIAQQHYYPEEHLIEWGRRNNVIFLTTVRHPGDTLVSLYHYIRSHAELVPADAIQAQLLDNLTEVEKVEQNQAVVATFLRNQFFCELSTSLSWLVNGQSLAVRYEDLWLDTIGTLTRLTEQIKPVSAEAIETAVELCDINLMRRSPGMSPQFFRKGGIGGWREDVPRALLDILEREAPYPQQFLALGYDLNPHNPIYEQVPVPPPNINPFRLVKNFDNGVAVAPVLEELYLKLPRSTTRQWPVATHTEPANSFYNWLNTPLADEQIPKISNLANYIYQSRPDVQAIYPTLEATNRLEFVRWFINSAVREYELADEFIQPLKDGYLEWATNHQPDQVLPLTNYLSYLYDQRPDLQAYFSLLDEFGRADYYTWFFQQGIIEDTTLEPRLIEAHFEIYAAWANQVSRLDQSSAAVRPKVTNLLEFYYRQSEDLQKRFPDIYGQNRIAFISWFIFDTRVREKIDPRLIVPIISSWTPATTSEQSWNWAKTESQLAG